MTASLLLCTLLVAAPPAERPATDRAREVVLLIVNAQTTPDVAWDSFDLPLSLSVILDAATSAQVNRYNLETVELLHRSNQYGHPPPVEFCAWVVQQQDSPALTRGRQHLQLSQNQTRRQQLLLATRHPRAGAG